MKKLFLLLLFCLIPSLSLAGTAYYCDLDAATNGIGTYANPWNSIAAINANKPFSTGDDLYFKVGSSGTMDKVLIIDWGGTSGDRVIIGAYNGDGDFGLDGGARPILDGTGITLLSGSGLVRVVSTAITGYITIRDLKIQNSTGSAIFIQRGAATADHYEDVLVDNCYTYRTVYQGILLSRTSNSTISGNTVEEASYGRDPGASIEVTGMDNVLNTWTNTVSGNIVRGGYEGIGSYRGAKYTIMDGNTVYDCRSYHLYATNSTHNIIRNNIAYNSGARTTKKRLIAVDCESGNSEISVRATGNNEIRGNFLAGGLSGVALLGNGNYAVPPVYQSNNVVADNIIADCDINIAINNSITGWIGNVIEHNASYTSAVAYLHSNAYSATGVTWGANLFDDTVSGNAGITAVTPPIVPLTKTTGWRTLTAGSVVSSDWALTVAAQAIWDGWAGVPTCMAPTVSPNGGDFVTSVAVTLATETSGAAIYYTVDGSTPTSGKTLYAAPFTLTANTTVKAIAIKADYNDSPVTTAVFTKISATQLPYGGTNWPIPGTLTLANFDTGGEGVAYHDTTSGNTGGVYRTSDNVDIWYNSIEGYYVGSFAVGEWLEFTCTVADSVEYQFNIRASATAAGKTIHIEQDGVDVSGTITLTNTGSYSIYATVTDLITLTAGTRVIRVYFDTGGCDISTIVVSAAPLAEVPPPTDFVILKDNTAANYLGDTTSLHLDWKVAAGATSYIVYSGTVTGEYIRYTPTTETDVTIYDIDPTQPIFLNIRAFIDDRPSAYVTELSTVWVTQTILGNATSNFLGHQAVELAGTHTVTITPTSTNYGVTAVNVDDAGWTTTTTPIYTFTDIATDHTIDWIVQQRATLRP